MKTYNANRTISVWLLIAGSACFSHIAAEKFTPGSDDINEAQILEQIEAEIGLRSNRSKEQITEKTTDKAKEPSKKEVVHTVQITTGDGSNETSGVTYFFQDYLTLEEQSGVGIRKIKIADVKALKIRTWQPTLARKLDDEQYSVLFLPHACTVELKFAAPVEGIIDGENWIQIVIRDNGEIKPVPLSFNLTIKARSQEEALEAASKLNSQVPTQQFSNIVFSDSKINELTSTNQD